MNRITYEATGARTWKGEVLYAGDNMNVQAWLASRQSSNGYARFLLLVLGAMKLLCGLRIMFVVFR
eukprot:9277378-Heterocapsa_arctica.AAC.1